MSHILSTLSLVGLLVDLIIGGIVIYAIYVFLGLLTLPPQLKTLILLVVAVIALVFLAGLFHITT